MKNYVFVHDVSLPIPEGYHRVVRTYDNLVPVCWADVKDGTEDPETIYLCTEAADIMLMSDIEYERYCDVHDNEIEKQSSMWDCLTYKDFSIFGIFLGFVVVGVILFAMFFTSSSVYSLILILAILFTFVGWFGVIKHFIKCKTRVFNAKEVKALPENSSDMYKKFEHYAKGIMTSKLAKDVLAQYRILGIRRDESYKLIDTIFGENSLTNAKFTGIVNSVCAHIEQNFATIESYMAAIDDLENDRVRSKYSTTAENIAKNRQICDENMTNISILVQKNETLLLELKRLNLELSKFDSDVSDDKYEAVLADIQGLIKDVGYYK